MLEMQISIVVTPRYGACYEKVIWVPRTQSIHSAMTDCAKSAETGSMVYSWDEVGTLGMGCLHTDDSRYDVLNAGWFDESGNWNSPPVHQL